MSYLLTMNRKSHIVDLLQLSSLGAFIHPLLSRSYLCFIVNDNKFI